VARTIIVSAGRGIRRVIVGDQIFPVGEAVPDVSEQTIEALEAMPQVSVDVAGEPDVDTPELTDEE
jgi:hypothetical protein